MYQKILVPVDGSDPSNCGLIEASKLAKNQNAQIRLLHVVDEHVLDTGYCIGTYPGDVVEFSREAGKKILFEGASLVRQYGLVPQMVAVESLSGNAASLIVAQASEWHADLIVMGTHGRHGIKRFAMGSYAENVVREARIPVLLIHDGSANTPEAQKAEAVVAPATQTVYA